MCMFRAIEGGALVLCSTGVGFAHVRCYLQAAALRRPLWVAIAASAAALYTHGPQHCSQQAHRPPSFPARVPHPPTHPPFRPTPPPFHPLPQAWSPRWSPPSSCPRCAAWLLSWASPLLSWRRCRRSCRRRRMQRMWRRRGGGWRTYSTCTERTWCLYSLSCCLNGMCDWLL